MQNFPSYGLILHTSKSARLTQRPVSVAIIDVPSRRVSCPRGEGPRGARRAEHGEGEDEYHDLRAAVERATQNVVVLLVPAGVVAPQPDLRRDPDEDRHELWRVRACAQVGGVLLPEGQ